MKRTTRKNRRCSFCPNNGKKKLRYIYPIPDPDNPGQVVDNRDGAFACNDCFPAIRDLQIEYGFVIDINGARREMEVVSGEAA